MEPREELERLKAKLKRASDVLEHYWAHMEPGMEAVLFDLAEALGEQDGEDGTRKG